MCRERPMIARRVPLGRPMSQMQGFACSLHWNTRTGLSSLLTGETLMKARTFLIGTSCTMLLAACSGADGMGPRVTKL